MNYIQLPRLGSYIYVAHGRDEHGWWEQAEPGGPKRYGADVEARMRAVLPDWMIDEPASPAV